MKRRKFIALGIGGLAGGVACAAGTRYLLGQTDSSIARYSLSGDTPSVETEPLFRFAAVGDVGTGAWPQYAVAQALFQYWKNNPFDRVLMTGDNIYPDGEIEQIQSVFEQPYSDLLSANVKFHASLGNHDFRTRKGIDQINYRGYHMAGRYYTFTQQIAAQQSVQFFVLDTNYAKDYLRSDRTSPDSWAAQLRWLDANLTRSSATWKIVYAHHPIYSSGTHGSNPQLIADLAPIFADHGVQLYLNGHDHNYERTQSIAGTTYLTTGNGAKLRPVGRSPWTAHATSQLGFTAFEVHANRLLIKAINTDHQVFDQAQISLTAA